MQFTGTNLTLSRDIFTQTGQFGFHLDCTVDNTTGQYLLGLSGQQGTLEFKLESGRMYYQNKFIHSYKSHQQFSIDTQFSQTSANITKDNVPLVYGTPKSTGNFNLFYIKRANDGMGADFDLYISGNNAPVYTITNQGYLFTTGQAGVTGYFVNQSRFPFTIFDSSIQATNNYTFGKLQSTINSSSTGIFSFSGDFNSFDLTQPILTTFNTDYGDESVLFTIVDVTSLNRLIYLTGPTDFTFNETGVMNRNITYLNYSGGFVTNSFSTALTINLAYSTGSGIFTGLSNYFTTGYGKFSESGLLTGNVNTITGNTSFSSFAWATGAATGRFSGIGTGWSTGFGYTGIATGYFTGQTTGFIFDGSGTLSRNQLEIGIGTSVVMYNSAYATGYIDFSSYNDGDGFIINNNNNITIFTVRAASGPGEVAPSCDGVGTYLMDNSSQITGIAPCLSGFTDVGVNGVYYNVFPSNIMIFTALDAGSLGNNISIRTDWGSPGDGNLTGGMDNSIIPGVTVYPVGPYTGVVQSVITGSGNYYGVVSGIGSLPYRKTFTGSWDISTGVDVNNLVSLKVPGGFSETLISGSGVFPPNSQVNFQINHQFIDNNTDGCYLVISGAEVINPISESLLI